MKGGKKPIHFITGNLHKFKEVSEIFNKSNLNQKYKLFHSNLESIEIQTDNLRDVAVFKIKSVKDKLNESCFVEDAGFFVDEPLNGFPGVYSAYIHKTIGNKGILKLIGEASKTCAHFESVIALYFKPINEIKIFKGEVSGKIAKKMRGNHGFGFDPIFLPDTFPDKTFSEISIEEKNKLSHRSQAFNKLVDFLKQNL